MSILQFLRIVWANRMLILGSTIVCFALAFLTVQLVPPRYEARSRVMLDVIKPDPVTGQVMATAFLRAYTKTQIELVKDQQVARRVVEDLNWANDPNFQRRYRERRGDEDLDFQRWAAQQVVKGADASLIQGSNILEITYSSSSAAETKIVADALRKAYMDMTLQSRRETARRNAEWYENQAEKAKSVLFQAEAAKSDYERQNGVFLQDDKVDIDSARLAALASQGSTPMVAPSAGVDIQSATQLAALDAEITEASKSMGPNHPTLQALKRRREVLAQQVAQSRNASSAAASAALSAARATSGMLEAQKAKVMAQRDKVERLRVMQAEIDLRRDQYNKAMIRAAQLRQEADVTESGVIPLGSAITPQQPEFPKKGLIMGAALAGGAGLGAFIGLLAELFGRRVRSAEDLALAIDAPVLAIIRNPAKTPKRKSMFALPSLAAPLLRRRVVRA
ncbi:MAG: hypothetical protein JNK30_06270 [Phenylobacterium sp.]|uniref:GumC family protein n=1 Tax=Phenylobacterium sp. TaxID=1871053 RepID=UPI001A512173|nr:Wzz/FepE/Etk N-terminal domain-containing protein [Phenylobacterium sp.]MBL8770971.1 hypothetical protein [Phenylobacterium sp.]